MKVKPFFFSAFVGLAACQTYDFMPVSPVAATVVTEELDLVAKLLPPNIMILLDKSNSMNKMVYEGQEVNGDPNAACVKSTCAESSTNCLPNCSTRINELRYAMRDFLEGSRQMSDEDPRPLGKFGLTLFPIDKECAAPNSVHVEFAASDEDAALNAKITDIDDVIFNLYNTPTSDPIWGGTPTGNALRFLLDNVTAFKEDTAGRRHFILLLTDGLPNCNDNLQEGGCDSSNECICTMQTNSILPGLCASKTNCGGRSDRTGCLDDYATVRTIEELRENDIETIVIGFGVDNVGDIAPGDILNAMAQAGGVSSDYFKAEDKDSLRNVLEKVSGIVDSNPCVYRLNSAPTDSSLLGVYVDDNRVPPGEDTYQYNQKDNLIEFAGELCELLTDSTPNNPVPLRISILKTID